MSSPSNIAVIPLEGDFDVTSAPGLAPALEQAVRAGCTRVIINMAAVRYMDTAGMGALVAGSRRMRAAGGMLSVANAGPQVIHALRVTRLVDFIPVKAAGAPHAVPELDPAVQPLWRRTLQVQGADIGSARRRLEQLCASLPFTAEDLFDVSLAAGEAIGNAVDHARCDCVLVVATAYPDRLVVQVSDCGAGFDPSALCAGVTGVERGRGIPLMRLLADDVSIVAKDPGPGMVVTLTKLVGARA